MSDTSSTTKPPLVSTAQDYFYKAVREWKEADEECGRAYAVWQEAKLRRLRLSQHKNAAWDALEAARVAAAGNTATKDNDL